MSDYETVKAMRDANWKPAVTYWKEKCDQADATIARLTAERDAARAAGFAQGIEAALAVVTEEARRQLWHARHVGNDTKTRERASSAWSALDIAAQTIRALAQQPEADPVREAAEKLLKTIWFDGPGATDIINMDKVNALRRALAPQPASSCPPPQNEDETYYSKGKTAEWWVGLTDEQFAWELICAAQDLNDTGLGDDLDKWMPHQVMLADAAKRIKRLFTAAEAWQPTHQHVKRGTEYRHIGTARIQSDVPLDDYSEVEVYIGAEGDLWARRKVEFHDGRFRALSPTPPVDVNETPVHYQQAGLSLTDDTQTPQADLETCPNCEGTGIAGHPDSGNTCDNCGGCGGVQADPVREAAEAVYSRLRTAQQTGSLNYGAGVYIASKTKYASEWIAVRDSGYPIIGTWIDEAGEGETGNWPDLWSRCVFEASSAKSLVVICRDGDTLKGAWVEVGAALGAGKTVFAAGCDSFTIRHHPRFVVCASEAEAFARATLAQKGE